MDGHAAEAAPEAGGLEGLASFLDTPLDEESTEETGAEKLADELTGDEADTSEEANDGQDEAEDDESQGCLCLIPSARGLDSEWHQ
jgi:hypothetical protein